MINKININNGLQGLWPRITGYNSTYPKGGFSFSKDSFIVNQTLVFQIKFSRFGGTSSGKSPALRVAAKRYEQVEITRILLLKKNYKPFKLIINA